MQVSGQRLGAAILLFWAVNTHAAFQGGDMERLINQEQLACSATLTGSAEKLDALLRGWGDARLECAGNAAPPQATTLRNLMGLRWMVTSVSHDVTLLSSTNGQTQVMVTIMLVVQRNLFSQGITR